MTIPYPLSDSDLDIVVRTVDGEARGEGPEGQAAVAWVIRNRASWDEVHADSPISKPEHEWWGRTPAGVCKAAWQFSCWQPGPDCDHITNLDPASEEYQKIAIVVRGVFAGTIEDPTGGATMYKVAGTKATWDHAVSMQTPRTIGHQLFFWLTPQGKTFTPAPNAALT